MKQVNWFDRKFNFNHNQHILPSIIERLRLCPAGLIASIEGIKQEILVAKPKGKWSILENIGHLLDLEPIWQGRLDDILKNETYLREADLSNTKTHQAQHNLTDAATLIGAFHKSRIKTLEALEKLEETDVFKFALHPRLHQPMRTQDLFLFVADHDAHHLAQITYLKRLLQS
ncbi:MAG: DinB family protein [Bacteroidota bacterium]